MLLLPEIAPNEYESAPPGALGQIEIPSAGKKHGEVVVLTPEQRRAVDDALAGDGVIAEVRRRALAPWAGDTGSSAPATPVKVPAYTVEFHQRMIAPPGVLVESLYPA
jgi:hypothetical protein